MECKPCAVVVSAAKKHYPHCCGCAKCLLYLLCFLLCRKLRRQIVDKEAAACAERQAAGSHKPIERSKLEANIKEFVRLSIRRLHTARPGAGAAGHGGMNGV